MLVQHPCLRLQAGASLTGLSPELPLLPGAALPHGVMGTVGFSKTGGRMALGIVLSQAVYYQSVSIALNISHLNPCYIFNCSLEHFEYVIGEKKKKKFKSGKSENVLINVNVWMWVVVQSFAGKLDIRLRQVSQFCLKRNTRHRRG